MSIKKQWKYFGKVQSKTGFFTKIIIEKQKKVKKCVVKPINARVSPAIEMYL